MARTRNIKPGFFINDTLAELDPLCRLLFIGLWTLADREGRLKDNPKKIKVQVLPYDDCDVDEYLTVLARYNFIQRFEDSGRTFIQICKFARHQNPHKNEPQSIIPKPPPIQEASNSNGLEGVPEEYGTSTVQEPEEYSSTREGIKVKGIKVKDIKIDRPSCKTRTGGDDLTTDKIPDPIPYKKIIDIWNKFASKWGKPQIKKINADRRKKIKRIYHMSGIKDFKQLETWENFYSWIETECKWLANECMWGWDGFHKEENFIKIIEGTYQDKKR